MTLIITITITMTITITITITIWDLLRNRLRQPEHQAPGREQSPEHDVEGGMIRLETLIELTLINSSCSSLFSYWNSTNNYLSSNSSRLYLNQQYPPPS